MPKEMRYNVYDNGMCVLHNAPFKKVIEFIGNPKISLARYIQTGHKYRGRYTFEYGDALETEVAIKFKKDWDAAVAPFKNVIWVKSGGKQLRVGGAHG